MFFIKIEVVFIAYCLKKIWRGKKVCGNSYAEADKHSYASSISYIVYPFRANFPLCSSI